MERGESGIFDRHWRLWVTIAWVLMAALLIYGQRNGIRWFSLLDTDDNLRIAQVRALLAGQDWFDLRQYKLNPPFGADVHWSRLVDLPIAAIKLALSPLLGGKAAERAAVTLAPLLPMLVAMLAAAATARHLLPARTFALAVAVLLCAHSARGMWAPLRIDHHGWQLAMLSVVALGLVDRRAARGGLLAGAATAASLTIGLEMLLYLALAGAVIGLRWVHDRGEARRLGVYGASLAGGSALGFLLFASYANRAPVCDALSPVWLSVMVLAGAGGVALSWLRLPSRFGRLSAAAAVGLLLIAFYVLAWPDCVGRLERSSPELEDLWLSHVREARPIYLHPWRVMVASATLPLIGLAGYAAMLWRARREPDRLTAWASLAALAALAAGLLLWQTRAGPAAQLLAVPGATGLGWLAIAWAQGRPNMLIRVVGTVLAFLLISGLGAQFIASAISARQPKTNQRAWIDRANARCPTLPALRPVALQPKGTVLTHVDLGPRLIAVTPHSAVAGPYHRNGADILAVMRAFRGTADAALRTVRDRRIDYVLICPNLSEATIYRNDAPNGFYVQLVTGRVPAWLEPVALPRDSPYRMWRVRR